MMVPYLPVQCHVLGVEEQQESHNLGPNPEFGQYVQIVVTNPRDVESCQLVLEESVENPESKVFLEKVGVHEDLDSTEV